MIKLYGRENSVNVQKVLWLLNSLQLPFERFDAGGPFGFPEEYKDISPTGLIPAVCHGEVTVWESNSALRYLASQSARGDRYYPSDLQLRTQVDAWMDWQLSTLTSHLAAIYKPIIREKRDPRGEAPFEAALKVFNKAFGLLDNQLAKKDFLVGDHPTLAEMAIAPYAYRWLALPIERPEAPHVVTWHKRLAKCEAYQSCVLQPLT